MGNTRWRDSCVYSRKLSGAPSYVGRHCAPEQACSCSIWIKRKDFPDSESRKGEEVTASLSLPHLCRQGWLTGWLAGSHQLRKGGGGGPAVAMKSFKHACCCTLLVLPHFRAAHGYMDVLRCTTRPARSAVDVSCTKWTPNTGHSDTQRHFPFEFEWASARARACF